MTTQAEQTDTAAVDTTHAEALAAMQRRDKWRRRLPLLPALLFTILVTQVPFVLSLFYSFTDWKVLPPQPREFTGLSNYVDGYSDPFFHDAVIVSILMTVSAVLLSLIVGTALALLLDRAFLGRGIVRTLLITPFLIMPVVAGLVWKNQMYSSSFGVLNWILEVLGLEAVPFVEQFPLWSIVVVLVWQSARAASMSLLPAMTAENSSVHRVPTSWNSATPTY